MRSDRWLGYLLIALGVALAANSLLGPLALGIIEYHLSDTLLNQGIGLDAFSLVIVTPLLVGSGMLILRGSANAPLIAIAPALYLPYMFLQYIAGPEYLLYEGNNESFFPLHAALLTLGAVAGVKAWALIGDDKMPRLSRRGERVAGLGVLSIAAFIAFGMYLSNGLIDALSDFRAWTAVGDLSRAEYRDNPHMYWTVVMMDLGILVPGATATGVALMRGGSAWAHKALYVVVGWLALVGPAVAAMGIAMVVNDDPSASIGKTVMFLFAAGVFVAFAVRLYWTALRISNRSRRPARGGFGQLARARGHEHS